MERHLTADYTIIMSRTLKVTGNHVMHDRSAWFLRVIMSSLHILCCLPSVKKQKHDFRVCFVDRRLLRWSSKNSWRQGHTKHKRSTKVARSCSLITWRRKHWMNLRKRKRWHKLWKHTFYVKARKKEFIQFINFMDLVLNQFLFCAATCHRDINGLNSEIPSRAG